MTTDVKARVFPLPMWLLAALLLVGEFSLYAFWLSGTQASRPGALTILSSIVGVALLVRLLIALASYGLSRWQGVAIAPEQRLGSLAWLRFFLVEYWHLCVQNLVLIPFGLLFRIGESKRATRTAGPVVLLQHGYVNNGAVWYFTARALEKAGFRVFSIDQPPFAPIDTMGELLDKRVQEVLEQTGAKQLTLVAHSMGGLICRAYLRRHGGSSVDRLVTMGSPHHGTFHAYLASGPNGRQMRPGNAWLKELNECRVDVPFISIYSVHDTIISPQDSSVVPEATNLELSAIGHVSMPSGKAMRSHLLSALRSQ